MPSRLLLLLDVVVVAPLVFAALPFACVRCDVGEVNARVMEGDGIGNGFGDGEGDTDGPMTGDSDAELEEAEDRAAAAAATEASESAILPEFGFEFARCAPEAAEEARDFEVDIDELGKLSALPLTCNRRD